jgi:hypothetical protein
MNLRPVTSSSNLARRAICPASAKLEEGLAEEDTPQSREGTLLHSYMENPTLDRGFLKSDQRDLLETAAQLERAVLQRVRDEYGDIGMGVIGTNRELTIHREGKPILSGHCDTWHLYESKKILVLLDYKFGFRPTTPAVANKQLRAYACGAAEIWNADRIVVAILQPRLSFSERITLAVYEDEDIEKAHEEIIAIIERTKDPDAPLNATEDGCRWCRAKLICPAFKEKFTWLSTEIKGRTPAAIKRTVADCTDEQLDRILVAIQFADFIKEAARDEARARLSTGRGLNGWELGKPTSVRKITDASRAISLLQLRGDLTRDEILEASNPSLTKLQDKLREKRKLTFKEAKRIIGDTLQSVIEVEERKASLMRKK